MPEHLRALVVILVIATVVFHMARPVAVQMVSAETFSRWRMAWFGLTLALFLSHGFWVYVLLLVLWVRHVARRESCIVGLFFVLLFVAPPSGVNIPFFGIIDHLFSVNHYRLLILVLLLPLAISLAQKSGAPKLGSSIVDWFVLSYFLVLCIAAFREPSITNTFRIIFLQFLDVLLPYYAISRSLKTMSDYKCVAVALALSGAMLSALAIVEVLRYWKLYQGLLVALGLNPWEFGGYLERAGVLRPNVTLGNSIVLGYVIMVCIGGYLFLMNGTSAGMRRYLGLALLVLGVIASLSRGPWIGLAAMLFMVLITGPNVIGRLVRFGVLTAIAFAVLGQTAAGRFLASLLPFLGDAETGSVDYRADLLTQALPVIERNFWFGSRDYLLAPELQVMIQGEGIIDIVNSYLAVALDYGVIGLVGFAGIFVVAAGRVLAGMRASKGRQDIDYYYLGRLMLATLVSVALVIYTVSSIIAVPLVYWCLFGLCASYDFNVRALSATGIYELSTRVPR